MELTGLNSEKTNDNLPEKKQKIIIGYQISRKILNSYKTTGYGLVINNIIHTY